MPWRSLVWLVAFAALLLPPSLAMSAATVATSHEMMSGCDHRAPPPPCPEKDNAKHTAGLCCPLMAQVLATLPAQVGAIDFETPDRGAAAMTARYAGLSPHKDPPPPRT